MLREWVNIGGHWMPERPYRPIGLLRTVLSWHGDLANPPAAAQRQRDAAELAARQAELERDRAERAAKTAAAATPQQRAAARQYFAEQQRKRRGRTP
jgi:hypothetical protein